jgi:hypothetical protein
MAQKRTALEMDAFWHAHNLVDHDPGARYDFGSPPDRNKLQNVGDRKTVPEAITDFSPLPWLEMLQLMAALPTFDPIDYAISCVQQWCRPIEQALYDAIGRASLDRLCGACALRTDPGRLRILLSALPSERHQLRSACSRRGRRLGASCTDHRQGIRRLSDIRVTRPQLVDDLRTAI